MEDEEPLQILLVEDDPDCVLLTTETLKDAGQRFSLDCVGTLAEAVEIVKQQPFSIILLDLNLPDSMAIKTLSSMRIADSDTPILVLTSMADSRLGIESLRRGAQDYLIKGDFGPQLLQRSITYAIERQRLLRQTIVELKRIEQLKADIRERKRLDQLKDELMHTVSHEIRSPLCVVSGAVDTLWEGIAGPLNEQQTKLIELARASAKRMSRFVGNLLDLARLESAKFTPNPRDLDLVSLIGDTVTSLKLGHKGKPVDIDLDIPAEPMPMKSDPELLSQVLDNLLTNALRFAAARVLLTAKPSPSHPDSIELAIEDDGPGLPPDKIGKLFEKFSQLSRLEGKDYKGTGLGLAICKEIIGKLGGHILAGNAPHGGARFTIVLPRRCGPKPRVQETASP